MPGVYNPFAPPKKAFHPSTGKKPTNTEYTEEPLPDIRLDGGTHTIVLLKTNLENVPTRLGEIVSKVAEDQADALARAGIAIGDSSCENPLWKACVELAPEVVTLQTPHGPLSICTDEQNEDEAFQRLGQALSSLVSPKTFKEYNVKIVVRL